MENWRLAKWLIEKIKWLWHYSKYSTAIWSDKTLLYCNEPMFHFHHVHKGIKLKPYYTIQINYNIYIKKKKTIGGTTMTKQNNVSELITSHDSNV